MSTETVEEVSKVATLSLASMMSKITTVLTECGHPNPTAWEQEMPIKHPDAMISANPSVLRHIVNSFWRNRLGNCSVETNADTHDARYCIDDNAPEADWLRLYKDTVVPCIIANNL